MSWLRRRKRKRAKARFKQEGMTARQLAAKVGVNVRTVRFYTAERVLPAPEFRGAATRYGWMHLLRMAAIRHLQRDKGLSLPSIRRHLESVDAAELERLAVAFLPELGAPAAEAVVAAPTAPVAAAAPPVLSVTDV
jgi:DNA-binding transcriptional MerR regulator